MINGTNVLRFVVLLTLLGALALGLPNAIRALSQWHEDRLEARDFAPASDDDQRAIVRAILEDRFRADSLCYLLEPCTGPLLALDRRAATAVPLGGRADFSRHPLVTYDVRLAVGQHLDFRAPPLLIDRLATLLPMEAENADPSMPGVHYIADAEPWPSVASPARCVAGDAPRVRISRAAVQRPAGIAIAMTAYAFCDGSGRSSFYKLERERDRWVVLFWT